MWLPPRPLSPATAMRMVSFAPRTLPDDLVPAMVTVAAVASVYLRNERRDTRGIEKPPGAGWEEVRASRNDTRPRRTGQTRFRATDTASVSEPPTRGRGEALE